MTDYKLSDSDIELAHRLNAAEGTVWRGKAQMIRDVSARANGTPKMLVYQTCAYALRLGVSTARLYVRLEEAFGAVLDECRSPDGDEIAGPDQLRRIYAEARAAKLPPDEVLIRRISEADEWGGQVAPPDVIAAQTRGKRDDIPPDVRALKSAARSLSTYLRHCQSESDRINVEAWVKWIEKRIEAHNANLG